MQKQTQACLYTLGAVLFWSTVATAFKIALQQVSSYTLLGCSTFVSCAALLCLLFMQGKQAALFRLSRADFFLLAALGFINPFLYYLTLFTAYSLLPGQVAMSLNYGWPFALTLLSVPILGQALTRKQVFAVLVSFFGAVIIATKGRLTSFGDVDTVGVLLALASTVIWAVYWLVNARDALDPVVKLFWLFCFGSFYALMFSPLFGGLNIPMLTAWPAIVYIGCFEMGITFVLWLKALTLSTSAARVGNLIYISPFLSLFFLFLVVGERIHPATFLGLITIVASIVFQEIVQKKSPSGKIPKGDEQTKPERSS